MSKHANLTPHLSGALSRDDRVEQRLAMLRERAELEMTLARAPTRRAPETPENRESAADAHRINGD